MAEPSAGISSMTGFGEATAEIDGQRLRIEIRSVNARGLDLRQRLPAGLDHLDSRLRERIRDRFARGTVQLNASVAGDSPALVVNGDWLRQLAAAARRLSDDEGFAPARADGLLALRGVIESGDADRSFPLDDDWRRANDDAVLAVFDQAIDALHDARRREGDRLKAIVAARIAELLALSAAQRNDPGRTPDAIAARLRAQVEALTATAQSLDVGRLHAEAALLAARADIAEEIDRIDAHCDAMDELLAAGGQVGRRLDFLSQELGREANTLCAKANSTSLAARGLDMKVVVDQLREQVQNIE